MAGSKNTGRSCGVLFDVDGTLIDSSYIHTLCWWQAFRQAGYDVPMASIHRSVGMGGDRLISHLLPDDRTDEAMKAVHGALFSAHWPGLRPFEAASELLAAACEGDGADVQLRGRPAFRRPPHGSRSPNIQHQL